MRLLLVGLLLLGGCSWFRGTPIPPEENTPDHQACRAEATNTPAQARLAEQINPNNDYNMQRIEQALSHLAGRWKFRVA